jgi:DNA-directed RNA polymerase
MYTLEEAQYQLEQEQTDIGVKRYREALMKAKEQVNETSISPQNKLMLSAIPPLAEAIRKFQEENKSSKAGRRKIASKSLDAVDADVVAFITSQLVINGISNRWTSLQLEMRISTAVQDYLLMETFKQSDKGLYTYAFKRAKQSGNQRYRRNSMRHYAKWVGAEVDQNSNILLGAFLLDLFIQTTGLVTKANFISGGKTKQVIQAAPEVMEWLQEKHSQSELMSPFWLPMVVKPTPWTNPMDGGYITLGLPIMKTGNKNYLQELEHYDLENIYRAINALQETPWRVNQTVLEVVNHLWETGAENNVLPPRNRDELPPKPCADEDVDVFKETNRDEWVKWRRAATAVHTHNNRMDSKRSALAQRLWMANKFADFDEIYFPHTMDWRGRVYPVVPLLNPQADDLGKALLEFAVGAELGENGEKWLKIHLSNCFGVDKVSMDDRMKWTDEHETHIRLVANDPYTYKFWMQADSPWQFLAACFEWERYKQSGEGASFISRLSVNVDGSCNGLQNFSAMLRDEIGGKATNLIPQETPADIYTEVAKVVQRKVTEDLKDPEKQRLAAMWDNKISRKIVKRQVMTLPYGSTEYGMRDQLKSELQSFKDDGVNLLNTNDNEVEWEAIAYLTSHIWDSIGEVVVAARQAMDWLKEVARIASSNELPLQWLSPSGLPVLQDYKKIEQKVVDTIFGKVRFKRKYVQNTTNVDTRRQANGVAPNFVHSCDAAHMIATINLCLEIGMMDFCMVHDSYGTHAGNVDLLEQKLREAFIAQYRGDVLMKLHEELERQTGLALPPPPPMGKLDLELIKDSRYFFA